MLKISLAESWYKAQQLIQNQREIQHHKALNLQTQVSSLRIIQQCLILYQELQIMVSSISSQGKGQQESLRKVDIQCHRHLILKIMLLPASIFQTIIRILYFAFKLLNPTLISGIVSCLGEDFPRIEKFNAKTKTFLSKPGYLVTLPLILYLLHYQLNDLG